MTDLTALALNAAQSLSVAEIHGVVCGLAVWQPERFELQELTDLVGVDALTDEFSVEAFVNGSVEALQAEDMSFAPLLPDDDVELEQRLDAVAEWCAGFLAGFGAAGMAREMSSLEVLPEEIQEIVGDLSAITDIDVDGIAGAQDDAEYGDADQDSIEEDLIQIHEFVKVGVLLIFSMINLPQDDSPGEFDG
ncbi:MAG: UPF0149 family protein [Gammaproteobacteria bacterium]|nr:UPF0149 family protein [Gammaproteobacteria bacterium]